MNEMVYKFTPANGTQYTDHEWGLILKNRNIIEQIAALEAQQTPRLLREAIAAPSTVYDASTGQTVLEKVTSLDAEISALRSQL